MKKSHSTLNTDNPTLSFYRLQSDPMPAIPEYATAGSACFDLAAHLIKGEEIEGVDSVCFRFKRVVQIPTIHNAGGKTARQGVIILPGETVKIPTGLILDIPEGYSVRVHIRSSVAYKLGLVLANNEGIIDSDYVDPLFLLIHNRSSHTHWIDNGQRLAQGELVKNVQPSFKEILARPEKKTDRDGGIGSTGV